MKNKHNSHHHGLLAGLLAPAKELFNRVSSFVSREEHAAARFVHKEEHLAAELGRDFYAGIHEPKAMSRGMRMLDEFRIASGVVATALGFCEVYTAPFVVTLLGGIEPAWGGMADICQAGHAWRLAHPSRSHS